MSEKVCPWCQRGYPLYDGNHYVVGAERRCVASPPAAPVAIAHPHETMNGVTILAAAPLSTLPERPDGYVECPKCDGWAEHVNSGDGSLCPLCDGTGEVPKAVADEIKLLRSRLSSLERELDEVRAESEHFQANIHALVHAEAEEAALLRAAFGIVPDGRSLEAQLMDFAPSALQERSE